MQIFDAGSLNFRGLNVTSFSAVTMQGDASVRKLLVVNNNRLVLSVDVQRTDYTLFTSEIVDLQNIVQTQGFFLPDSERLVNIALLYQQVVGGGDQNALQVLVFTEDLGLLELSLTFQTYSSDTAANGVENRPFSWAQLVSV